MVSSSTTRERPEGDRQRLVEGADLLVDLGRIAGHRDQEAAVVAEIDRALDQAQPLVLRAARRSRVRVPSGPRRDAAGPRGAAGSPSHSEREARTSGRGASSRVTCQYQPDSGSSNSGSPSWPNFSPASSGEATSATSVLR